MSGKKRLGTNQITLARALSKFGVVSRKQAGEVIRRGSVSVNARKVLSPDQWVDPKSDKVTVDGKPLRQQKLVYLVLNKPPGVVTTRSDELGRKTVYDLLPDDSRWLFPVGRLDKDTSGLLLLTNDSRFGDKITSPLTKVPKMYAVAIDKRLRPDDRKLMESTFTLRDETLLRPAVVSVDKRNPLALNMTITEGKNRQIRRLCEELGYEVRSLCRLSIGPIRLGNLAEGEARPLTEKELSLIKSLLSLHSA